MFRATVCPSMDALPANRTWPPSRSHGTYQHKAITSRSLQLLMMGTWLPETCWATIRREIKEYKKWHLVGFSYPYGIKVFWPVDWAWRINSMASAKSRSYFVWFIFVVMDQRGSATIKKKKVTWKKNSTYFRRCYCWLIKETWWVIHPDWRSVCEILGSTNCSNNALQLNSRANSHWQSQCEIQIAWLNKP